MKVLILHPSSRYDRYLPDIPAAGRMELVFTDREGPEERWLAAGGDAEALVAAPVTPVTEELIARMPHLKLIHSDGVGYDRIDLAAARERGIYVCNCAGCCLLYTSQRSMSRKAKAAFRGKKPLCRPKRLNTHGGRGVWYFL